jgi:hypothetical protein
MSNMARPHLLHAEPVPTPLMPESAFATEFELAEVALLLRTDMEILCPTPEHPAYIPQTQSRDSQIIASTKALYEDPSREHVRVGNKYAEPVTRAWLARFPEQHDLIYLVADNSYLLPNTAVAMKRRPAATNLHVHARFFPDGRYEFNPELYGKEQTVTQRKEVMEHVIDTVIEIGNQHKFEVTRKAAMRRSVSR